MATNMDLQSWALRFELTPSTIQVLSDEGVTSIQFLAQLTPEMIDNSLSQIKLGQKLMLKKAVQSLQVDPILLESQESSSTSSDKAQQQSASSTHTYISHARMATNMDLQSWALRFELTPSTIQVLSDEGVTSIQFLAQLTPEIIDNSLSQIKLGQKLMLKKAVQSLQVDPILLESQESSSTSSDKAQQQSASSTHTYISHARMATNMDLQSWALRFELTPSTIQVLSDEGVTSIQFLAQLTPEIIDNSLSQIKLGQKLMLKKAVQSLQVDPILLESQESSSTSSDKAQQQSASSTHTYISHARMATNMDLQSWALRFELTPSTIQVLSDEGVTSIQFLAQLTPEIIDNSLSQIKLGQKLMLKKAVQSLQVDPILLESQESSSTSSDKAQQQSASSTHTYISHARMATNMDLQSWALRFKLTPSTIQVLSDEGVTSIQFLAQLTPEIIDNSLSQIKLGQKLMLKKAVQSLQVDPILLESQESSSTSSDKAQQQSASSTHTYISHARMATNMDLQSWALRFKLTPSTIQVLSDEGITSIQFLAQLTPEIIDNSLSQIKLGQKLMLKKAVQSLQVDPILLESQESSSTSSDKAQQQSASSTHTYISHARMATNMDLQSWALRFELTPSTIQVLSDEGVTSIQFLAQLTPEIIDNSLSQIKLGQKLMLKKAVQSLQVDPILRESQESSSTFSDKAQQQSASSTQTQGSLLLQKDSEDNNDKERPTYEGSINITATGVTGGEHQTVNVVGLQDVDVQNIENMNVTEQSPQGTGSTSLTVTGATEGNHESVNVVGLQDVHVQNVGQMIVTEIVQGSTGVLSKGDLDLKIEAAKRVFVETDSYRRIKDQIQEHGHITICGASGEGKTTMSLMLGLHYREMGYEIVFVDDITLFELDKHKRSMQRLFLILDDVFGEEWMSLHLSKIEQFLEKLELYLKHCRDTSREIQQTQRQYQWDDESRDSKQSSKEDIVIVFSSRSHKFKTMFSQMSYMKLFRKETLIDLTEDGSYHYSQLDMEAIFEHHRDVENSDFKEDIDQILKEKYSLFGFPMTCKLYFGLLSKDVRALDFFRKPLQYLRIELNELLHKCDDKSAVLILMFLCEDKLYISKLLTCNKDPMFERKIEIIPDFHDGLKSTCPAMYKEAESLKGTFFVGSEFLSFAHSSIFDACACEAFEVNENFVLLNCSDTFLYEWVKPKVTDSNEVDDLLHFITVSKPFLGTIATRLANDIQQGRFAKSVTHPILTNEEVYIMLLEKLRDQHQCSMNLSAESSLAPKWIHGKDEGKGFLYWAILGHTPEVIQDIEKDMKLTFTQSEISEGFDACVQKDNLTILKNLQSRTDRDVFDSRKDSLLLSAVKNGSSDVAIHLLQQGANPYSVDEEKFTILHLACKSGQIDLINEIKLSSLISSETFTSLLSCQDCCLRTPLMFAADVGSKDFVQLFKPQSDLNATDRNGNSILHLACRGGNSLVVQEVLSQSNINQGNSFGTTPVMQAVVAGQKDAFELLVSKKADLNVVDDFGNTVLYLACHGCNKSIIQCLLSSSNINSKGKYGHTPVMTAAWRGQRDVYDLLVSKEADIKLVDDNGDTALHLACQSGDTFIVQDLLKSVDTNVRGLYGKTPIMIAAQFGQQRAFELLLLHLKEANLTCLDDLGNSLLNLACRGGNKLIVEKHLLPLFNINIRGEFGRTPVMNAAYEGQHDVFELLVSKDADLKMVDDGGFTVLHLACRGGNVHIVQQLLTRHNINCRGKNGWTPVMIAVLSGQINVLELLVSKNADLTLVDDTDSTLVHLACKSKDSVILKRLLTLATEKGIDINAEGENGWTPVMVTAMIGAIDAFLLLETEANVKQKTNNGDTLLSLACAGGNRFIVQYLISFSSIDINSRGFSGLTAVMYAASKGCQEAYKILVFYKADLKLVDDLGDALIHKACKGGNKYIVQHLLSFNINININIRGEHGRTPVMMAAISGQKDVFDLLAEKKADLTLKDHLGNEVIHLACKGENKFIVDQLLPSSNINSRGEYGRTPVMLAAVTGQKNVFDLLVEKKADMSLMDVYGNSILHMACQGGSKLIVQYLLTSENIDSRAQEGLTPVLVAAVKGQKGVFDLLVSENPDLNVVTDTGNTLLHMACKGGDTSIVEKFLKLSNINSRGECGRTPIMIAAFSERKAVFNLLMAKKANLALVDELGNALIHLACKGGNRFIVENLLNSSNINIKGEYGRTPVMVAAIAGHYDVFKLLKSQKADLTLVDNAGDTLLHLACCGDNRVIISSLLELFNINSRGIYGRTPVMVAAFSGRKSVFELLVKTKNVNLATLDDQGNTLLNMASHGGNKFIVEYLLPSSDINRRGEKGWTPVMNAANEGKRDIFELLISKKADLTLMDDLGNTILHLACQGGNVHIAQTLLKPNNVNIRGQNGRTPVMMASFTGQKDVFDLLVSKQADLTLLDNYGDSVLHLACIGGNKFIVQFLLKRSNINSKGKFSFTPVMRAVDSGQKSVFDLLVSKKADLEVKTDRGNTLLHLACAGGNKFIVQYLLKLSPKNINEREQQNMTPIMAAAVKGQKAVFDLLVSKKADLTLVAKKGGTLLNFACRGGNLLIVQYLLRPSNINCRGEYGQTPVMIAALEGHYDLFKMLISEKADLTLKDDGGYGLLHLSCKGGNKYIVQYLLRPSNINCRGEYGQTPVMIASLEGHYDLFKMLISEKADLTLKDDGGDGLLHLSCKGGNKYIVQYLLPSSDINSRGKYHRTPVMIAALNAKQPVFDLLLSQKADLKLVDIIGKNVFDLALKGGNKVIVSKLRCAWCHKSGLRSCSQCHSVRYCSKICQKKHWKSEHKEICIFSAEKSIQ